MSSSLRQAGDRSLEAAAEKFRFQAEPVQVEPGEDPGRRTRAAAALVFRQGAQSEVGERRREEHRQVERAPLVAGRLADPEGALRTMTA